MWKLRYGKKNTWFKKVIFKIEYIYIYIYDI